MSLLPEILTRLTRTVMAYAGDETLVQAGVSAAANVMVADGEIASEEFETAVSGMLADPIVAKGYDLLMLEEALFEAIGRARTRAGRVENLRRVAMIAGRTAEQREGVFLVAADVADHEGIAAVEDAALTEIAAALLMDKAALLRAVAVRPMSRQTAA